MYVYCRYIIEHIYVIVYYTRSLKIILFNKYVYKYYRVIQADSLFKIRWNSTLGKTGDDIVFCTCQNSSNSILSTCAKKWLVNCDRQARSHRITCKMYGLATPEATIIRRRRATNQATNLQVHLLFAFKIIQRSLNVFG